MFGLYHISTKSHGCTWLPVYHKTVLWCSAQTDLYATFRPSPSEVQKGHPKRACSSSSSTSEQWHFRFFFITPSHRPISIPRWWLDDSIFGQNTVMCKGKRSKKSGFNRVSVDQTMEVQFATTISIFRNSLPKLCFELTFKRSVISFTVWIDNFWMRGASCTFQLTKFDSTGLRARLKPTSFLVLMYAQRKWPHRVVGAPT